MNQGFLSLRTATEEDSGFIQNSWLRSFYHGSPWAKLIPHSIFFKEHQVVVKRVLAAARVLVACNPEDPSQIYGYVVYTPSKATIIHYVYVKQAYRKLGIATRLYREATKQHAEEFPVTMTQPTVIWEMYLRDKTKSIFNPYALFLEVL